MKPIEFVEGVIESVVNSNFTTYHNIFEKTNQYNSKDPYWIDAFIFFNSLDSKQKGILFKIIRQVEVDTVSKFLSILDGVTFLDNQKSDFILTTEDDGEILNGDLQDIFLEIEND